METIKLTQEEIDSLKSIQEESSNLTVSFGQLEMAFQSLKLQKENLVKVLVNLKNKETEIGTQLQEKYGNGNINIETGEFTKVN
jgi:K+/H+ antiporter YhaU regulatory subunit KhtT